VLSKIKFLQTKLTAEYADKRRDKNQPGLGVKPKNLSLSPASLKPPRR
jgi:hypothetical protein